ncbi:MAG: response regulator, partial [Candidatus Cloacimonadaceae bacterium]|nr:response regulator [Candidatus Cloacimonadaceae bacterium]
IIQLEEISLIISDIVMPGMSGLQLFEQIRAIDPSISVILITGSADQLKMRRAIQLGAFDFLRKPFDFNEIYLSVKQGVEKCKLLRQNEAYKRSLEIEIKNRTSELRITQSKLENSYLNTIYALVNAIEVNDIYTRGHSERVTVLSMLLAKEMKLSKEELSLIHLGSLLHDIGKIGVYDHLVKQDQTLSVAEYDRIKQHPVIGDKIIAPVGLPRSVHDIILQHHEWVNGYGYPFGIKNDEISFYAKIVSVADAFDAMTSHRPYRDDLTYEDAFREIVDSKNIQFAPDIADIFYHHKKTILEGFLQENSLAMLLSSIK